MSPPPEHPRAIDDDTDLEHAAAEPGLDLTPRRDPTPSGSTTKRVVAVGAVVVLLVGLGVVVVQGLTDAATFYYNVDEAVQTRDELGDQRFRMQGNVVDGTIAETDSGVEFTLAYGNETVAVEHRGDPPELFSAEIPVIIEGSFTGDRFESDEILIRHDSTYEEENEERLDDAERDAERRAQDAG